MSRMRVLLVGVLVCVSFSGCPNTHKAGDVATFEGIEFVWSPSGSFMMGMAADDWAFTFVELPVHEVTFSKGFWISKYEVTQAQWLKVMSSNPSAFVNPNHPVDSVSWDDAKSYVAALNAAYPNHHFRLPSESEWEYACRAGTDTRFYWGDDMSEAPYYAWYAENSDLVTHTVGKRLPNNWGIYDMSGNVWEWVEDYYHENHQGAPDDGGAWLTPQPGLAHNRVLRGGCYDYEDFHCQYSVRGVASHDNNDKRHGFRLAKF